MNYQTPFCIVSSQVGDNPYPERHATLLRGYPGSFEVEGSYRNETEKAILLPLPLPGVEGSDYTDEERLIRLGQILQQESILLVDSRRRAALVFIQDKPAFVDLGQFRSCLPGENPASYVVIKGQKFTTDKGV